MPKGREKGPAKAEGGRRARGRGGGWEAEGWEGIVQSRGEPVPVGGSGGTEGLASLNPARELAWGSEQRQLFPIFFHDSIFFFLTRRIKVYPKNRKCLFKKGCFF